MNVFLWMNVFMNECFLWMNVICEWINDFMNKILDVCFFYWVRTTFLLKKGSILMILMNALPTDRPTNRPTNQPTDQTIDRRTDKAGCRIACTRLKKDMQGTRTETCFYILRIWTRYKMRKAMINDSKKRWKWQKTILNNLWNKKK